MARVDWRQKKIWADPAVWAYLLFSFEGRISRLPFWVAAVLLNIAAWFADQAAFGFGGNPASAVVGLAFLYPSLALATKRGHDRGHSELYLLFFFLPAFLVSVLQVLGYVDDAGAMRPVLLTLGLWVLAAIIALVIDLGLMAGEPGENRYGPNPLD
jgi:uncharacterized membrane protein YhaH (DUF805 family)